MKQQHIINLIFCLISLAGCRNLVEREPLAPDMNRQTMQKLMQPVQTTPPPCASADPKKKVEIQPIFLQSVSVCLSENTPLKPVLIELARQAHIDLQLDPKIDAKIVFSAKQKPFIHVIENICDLAGLRYRIIDQSLRIEIDTPYVENYNVQFLNLARSSENRISIATDVFADAANPAGKNSQDNGSDSSVSVSGNNDFWGELESNLKIILSQGSTTVHPGSYSLHKQGGIVSISGSLKQHQLVKSYLDTLRKAASSQVLIEAKIIEVVLKDEYRSGINWQKVGSRNDLQVKAPFGDLASSSSFLDPTSSQTNLVSFGAAGKTFSVLLEALQEFGSSRTLSSPRLTVMNNQTAILKVAHNQVYFRLHYDKQYNTAVQRESVSVSSDIQTVPIGLVMSVQPSIDLETGEIILFLRPTISRLNQSVRDPAVDIVNNSMTTTGTTTNPSLIPVVEVREIDSILRLKDGEIAILGGLMEVRSIQDINKLPVLGDLEPVKELFRSNTENDSVVELVILLRASIAGQGAPSPHPSDDRLKTYVPDPRPF